MQEGSIGRILLVIAASFFATSGATVAVPGAQAGQYTNSAHYKPLPVWKSAQNCDTRTISGLCGDLQHQNLKMRSGDQNIRIAQADAATATEATASGYAVLPTTSVDEVFAAREAWGNGPPAKDVEAPLAAGATSPLPENKMAAPKGFEGEPTVHALEATPPPQLTPVPQGQVDDAMKALLAEREGWLKAPASAGQSKGAAVAETKASKTETPEKSSSDATSDGSGDYAVLPTTGVDEVFAAREAWGKSPPPKTVEAPLATGAYSPLPADKLAVPKGFDGEPTVHALEQTPPAQLTPVPQGQIDDAMKSLLAEREGWGTEPAAGGAGSGQDAPAKSAAQTATATQTAEKPAPDGAGRSAEAADCEAKLRKAAEGGVIRFASASVTIDSGSNATLDTLAEVAMSCKKGRIRVEGHTDSTGRAAFNKTLSEKRAQSVVDYLSKAGVDASRIEAVGYGQEKPIASNNTREGRAKNRRIEFTVVE